MYLQDNVKEYYEYFYQIVFFQFSPRPNIHSHYRQHIEHIGSDLANVAAYYKRPDLKCAKRTKRF